MYRVRPGVAGPVVTSNLVLGRSPPGSDLRPCPAAHRVVDGEGVTYEWARRAWVALLTAGVAPAAGGVLLSQFEG